jgi:hypothetical protein
MRLWANYIIVLYNSEDKNALTPSRQIGMMEKKTRTHRNTCEKSLAVWEAKSRYAVGFGAAVCRCQENDRLYVLVKFHVHETQDQNFIPTLINQLVN